MIMGWGGARPGAGRPKRHKKTPADVEAQQERPEFDSARSFALWALNADDVTVSMDQKIRACMALLSLEGKQAAAAEKPEPLAATGTDGLYAPRSVRGYGVVAGGRQ
jgi:hypothetical protein